MSILCCPVCGAALIPGAKAVICPSGHSFDRARQGYVNLLGSQQSSLKRHGDDRVMVTARRVFLSAGHYEPLRRAIAEVTLELAPGVCRLLDVGCGEGYYTHGVYDALTGSGTQTEVTAIDISRDAAKSAAARPFPHETVVASAYSLPVPDKSCDILLCVFAPVARQEFYRVLKPGGVLIRAVPGERHLFGLKERIYEKPYLNPPAVQELEGFEPIHRRDISWTLRLDDPADIDALFKMTPYYYKTSAADQNKAASLKSLETELSFSVFADRRTG